MGYIFPRTKEMLGESHFIKKTVMDYGGLDDGYIKIPTAPFPILFYGIDYKDKLYVGTNSYVTFGYGTTVYSAFSATKPGKGLFVAARDNKVEFIGYFFGVEYVVLHFEGTDRGSNKIIWQLYLWDDGTIELVTDPTGFTPPSAYSAITNGVDDKTAITFTPTKGKSYVFLPNETKKAYDIIEGVYQKSPIHQKVTALNYTPTGYNISVSTSHMNDVAIEKIQLFVGEEMIHEEKGHYIASFEVPKEKIDFEMFTLKSIAYDINGETNTNIFAKDLSHEYLLSFLWGRYTIHQPNVLQKETLPAFDCETLHINKKILLDIINVHSVTGIVYQEKEGKEQIRGVAKNGEEVLSNASVYAIDTKRKAVVSSAKTKEDGTFILEIGNTDKVHVIFEHDDGIQRYNSKSYPFVTPQ